LAPRTATQWGSTTGPYNREPQREDEKQKINTKAKKTKPNPNLNWKKGREKKQKKTKHRPKRLLKFHSNTFKMIDSLL